MRRLLLVLLFWSFPLFPAFSKIFLVLNAPDVAGVSRHFRTTNNLQTHVFPQGVSLEGLQETNISGSAQYSESQFKEMLKLLPERVVVVDLRQESHGFLNGVAVSWYGLYDWANRNDGDALAAEKEKKHLENLKELQVTEVFTYLRETPQEKEEKNALIPWQKMPVLSVQSERQLVESAGKPYQRFYITDHIKPTNKDVDLFMAFWEELAPDTWIHFHCGGGDGRTTTFMVMVDILKNAPKVAFEDILARQAAMGPFDLRKMPSSTSYKYPYAVERLKFVQDFYAYVRETSPPRPLWSTWVQSRN